MAGRHFFTVQNWNSKTTMDIYARVKYNKPEQLFDVVNSAFHQAVPS